MTLFAALKQLAIDADVISFRISLAAQFGDRGSIDLHVAGSDQFFGFAAGSDSGGGDDFLQAFRRHVGRMLPLERTKELCTRYCISDD